MSEVAPITVELSHREVLAASAQANPKPPSHNVYLFAVMLWFMLSMEAGLSGAFMISQQFDPPHMVLLHQALSMIFPALLAIFGLVMFNRLYNRVHERRYARDRDQRQVPDSVQATYFMDNEGVRLETPRGQWLARWISISELRPASSGWLFVNDLGTLYVPRRGFADAAHERDFVAAALERMPGFAREASSDARSWLASA